MAAAGNKPPQHANTATSALEVYLGTKRGSKQAVMTCEIAPGIGSLLDSLGVIE
jgi:hypothetical protein